MAAVPPQGQHQQLGGDEELDPEQEESKLPPPLDGVREHYLLLDIQPSATAGHGQGHGQGHGAGLSDYEVTSAYSLSSEWQILSTSITNAPTIDAIGPGPDEAGEGMGLMLKIEGRGPSPDEQNSGKGRSGVKKDKVKETLEEMVDRFEKRLDEIRRTIAAGGDLLAQPSKQELGE